MSSKFNLVKKPEKKDEDEEEEIEVEIEEDSSSSKSSSSNVTFKKRMIMFMGIILGGLILLLLILFVCSFFTKRIYTYADVEKELKDAAIAYFKEHPENLPEEDGDVVEIDSSNLVAAGKMLDLSEYTVDGDVCTGYVQVEKSGSEYLYSPFLNCGEKYTTVELYNKVVDNSNVVTSGYGLYQINGSYVFRGEDVNNYVQLFDKLWRIVKITNDNNVVLVSEDGLPYTQPWDNRYNADRMYESGINQFSASRIKEYLDKIYNHPSEENEEILLSKKEKALIVSQNLCTAKRSVTSQSNDNSLECAEVLQGQRYGLLTVSDYMLASIDPTCKTPSDKSCLNYNYLAKDFDWWLATANSDDNSTVFVVDSNGYITTFNASNYAVVRPTIYLNSKVMFKSGNGSLEKPYKIK